ncbi:MAG: type II toxin-antitoxin system RelE/ParE family toxin [Kiritimatiellae bacterium]|nr:type II toxin-antitoxin system RelE/ParE family toxin [Kiritimatiellia bacterium]
MKIRWSPHAKGLLVGVLSTIRLARSALDAAKWNAKITKAASQLADFPEIGAPEIIRRIMVIHTRKHRSQNKASHFRCSSIVTVPIARIFRNLVLG